MKKISFFTAFVLTVAAAVCACTKEDQASGEVTPREKVISVLHASLEQFGQGTKTYFSNDTTGYGGYPVFWEEEDSLFVANVYRSGSGTGTSRNCGVFVLVDGIGTMDGVFEKRSALGSIRDDTCFAFYPRSYCTQNLASDPSWGMDLPIVQKYDSRRAFAKNAFPEYAMVEKVSSETLIFKSMMSILKLRLHSTEGHLVRTIMVTTADPGKYLSGKGFKVDMITGNIYTTSSNSDLSKVVYLVCDEPMGIDVDTTFYVVLPPAEYNNLTVWIKSEKDGVPCIMNRTIPTHSSTLYANRIRAMATLEVTGGGYNPPHYKEASYGSSDSTDYGPGVLFPDADVYWAPVNCGIGTDYEYPKGLLYQWGRKYGQVLENVQEDSLQTFADGQDASKREYFAANYASGPNPPLERWWRDDYNPGVHGVWSKTDTTSNPCPEGWRVPTVVEFEALLSHVPQTPRNTDILFKVGYDSLSLPRAGYHYQGGVYQLETDVLLWTSTIYEYSNTAKAHVFTTGGYGLTAKLRNGQQLMYSGLSVRCVHDL